MTNEPIAAVFLDRDGVICRRHERRSEERNRIVGELLGRPDFHLTEQDEYRLFFRAWEEPTRPPIGTMDTEEAFWNRWGELLLQEYGMGSEAAAVARDICARYPFHTMLEHWPDAPGVLETLQQRGYRMAVISNTFPSLQASVEAAGLGSYFEAFIASSMVGISKPDRRIYEIALETLGVAANASVFVDDSRENADAARAVGFTAFHLDRRRAAPDWDSWTIHSLDDLTDYLPTRASKG